MFKKGLFCLPISFCLKPIFPVVTIVCHNVRLLPGHIWFVYFPPSFHWDLFASSSWVLGSKVYTTTTQMRPLIFKDVIARCMLIYIIFNFVVVCVFISTLWFVNFSFICFLFVDFWPWRFLSSVWCTTSFYVVWCQSPGDSFL